MKIKFLFLTLGIQFLLFNCCLAQDGPPVGPELKYTAVVRLPDSTISAKELYERSEQFFLNKKVTKFIVDDVETAITAARVNFNYEPGDDISSAAGVRGKVEFVVTIQCKKGRYKYNITYFRHISKNGFNDIGPITEADTNVLQTSHKKYYDEVYADIKSQVPAKVKAIIAELQQAMAKKREMIDNNW